MVDRLDDQVEIRTCKGCGILASTSGVLHATCNCRTLNPSRLRGRVLSVKADSVNYSNGFIGVQSDYTSSRTVMYMDNSFCPPLQISGSPLVRSSCEHVLLWLSAGVYYVCCLLECDIAHAGSDGECARSLRTVDLCRGGAALSILSTCTQVSVLGWMSAN